MHITSHTDAAKQEEVTTADASKYTDDAEVARMQAAISRARVEVGECHAALTAATARLKTCEEMLATRVKMLRIQADACFDWRSTFPWDECLTDSLTNVFQIHAFRPLQRESLNATLLKRDVFAILPTGAGKSLIYQLAAIVDGGVTLVVTPLISLSVDQRAGLHRRGITAVSLDSYASKTGKRDIFRDVLPAGGRMKGSVHPRKRIRGRERGGWERDDVKACVLFVTPEQVAKSKTFMSRLEMLAEMGHLSRICVDEAHCCSTWGHDFRAEYRKLGVLRRSCPGVPILALSATCAVDMTEDVSRMLGMEECVVFRGSVDRPNLFYEVRRKAEDDASIIADIRDMALEEFGGLCGIVYVLSRKETVTYATGLQQLGVRAGAYNGDMEGDERLSVQEAWSDGRLQVVVATIAFGLGIDNPRVRFVVHATMATSLEAYYQESGRAGRDGQHANCIILHRAKEFARVSGFVADKGGGRLRKFYALYAYVSARGMMTGFCRRASIARAFGEKAPVRKTGERAKCCDVCAMRYGKGTRRICVVDVTALAKAVVEIVTDFEHRRMNAKMTLSAVANDWSNCGVKGKDLRGKVAAIDRRVSVDTRLEIMAALVLGNWLQEYHRHSSYAVNAYVTAGGRVGPVKDVTICVDEAQAAILSQLDCRILWNSQDNQDDVAGESDDNVKMEAAAENDDNDVKVEDVGENEDDDVKEEVCVENNDDDAKVEASVENVDSWNEVAREEGIETYEQPQLPNGVAKMENDLAIISNGDDPVDTSAGDARKRIAERVVPPRASRKKEASPIQVEDVSSPEEKIEDVFQDEEEEESGRIDIGIHEGNEKIEDSVVKSEDVAGYVVEDGSCENEGEDEVVMRKRRRTNC